MDERNVQVASVRGIGMLLLGAIGGGLGYLLGAEHGTRWAWVAGGGVLGLGLALVLPRRLLSQELQMIVELIA